MDSTRQFEIPLRVGGDPGVAQFAKVDDAAVRQGDVHFIWHVVLAKGTNTYQAHWGIAGLFLAGLGKQTQEWDLAFGLVAALRRRVWGGLQEWRTSVAVGRDDEHVFQPISTLEPRPRIERDIEVILFDLAWQAIKSRVVQFGNEGGSLRELALRPSSEWAKNETLLRRDGAYGALKEFYDKYDGVVRNRSFTPTEANALAVRLDQLIALGVEALSALWSTVSIADDASRFWQMLLRVAPSNPEGGHLSWHARVQDLLVMAGSDGIRLRRPELLSLLTEGAAPSEFPWDIMPLDGERISFVPRALGASRRALDPLPLGPVRLRSLEIQFLRNIDVAKIDFVSKRAGEPNTVEETQCLIILGENGSGKTTILQALALGLMNPDAASSVLARFASDIPLIRHGYDHARCIVACGTVEREVEIHRRGTVEYARSSTRRMGSEVSVYGYGAHRGVGGRAAEISFGEAEAVATLFDPRARLLSADVWLLQTQVAALRSKGGPEEAFYEAVVALLKYLLPGVETVEVGDGITLAGPNLGTAPLIGLSGGYITMASWILDLVARATANARRNGIAVDGMLASQLQGVVLVDEVDLHLHPRWQRNVVVDLRRAFPRLTFVVSTHSPMVVVGANAGEVLVIERDAGALQLVRLDVPRGSDASSILTDWFGLASTTDPETTQMLRDYSYLLAEGGPDAPQARELERRLRTRLGAFAATPIERVALQVAAEYMARDAETLENLSASERAQLVEKIEAAVRGRLEDERRR